jgi:hypothetical protein
MYAPPVRQVFVGSDSTIWLQREWTGAVSTWDVLDSKGKLMAHVELPESLSVLAVGRRVVWGTEVGSDGQTLLVRYVVDAQH